MDKTIFKGMFEPITVIDKQNVNEFKAELERLAENIAKQKAVIERMKELN